MEISNFTIKILDNEYVVIKNNLNRKYIKLGYSETKYLLSRLNISIDALDVDISKVFHSDDLNDESKAFMEKKFEEWGFWGEFSKKPEKKAIFKDVSKIQLFKINPESFLKRIPRKIGLIYSIPGIVSLFIISVLKYFLSSFIPQSFAEYIVQYTVSVQDAIIVFFMVTATLVLHEISHALACRHYGGNVTSMGMVLYFFTPCFFCDVSDIYLSSNKKNSFFVGIGGIVANLWIGNLAFILYCVLASFFDTNLPFLLLFWFSNLGVIIFNLLPFVKLDGYWILSAVTGITNLMDKSIMVIFCAVTLKFKTLKSIVSVKKYFLFVFGCTVIIFRPLFWVYSLQTIYDLLINLGVNSYICISTIVVLSTLVLIDQIRFFVQQISNFKRDGKRILSQL